MKFKSKKKGMLLASEVVKIVLSIIAIVFLIYLLISLYYSSQNSQKQQEAQSTMKRIQEIVSRIENNAITSESIPQVSPNSWNFFSFVGNEKKPNSCAGADCLCICDKVLYDNVLWFKDRQLNECDTNGACIAVKNLKSFNTFEIKSVSDGGTTVNITKSGNYIEVINL